MDAKIDLEAMEARDSRNLVSRQFDYSKNAIMIYIVEEHLNFYAKLGVAVGFDSSSSINGSDKMLG